MHDMQEPNFHVLYLELMEQMNKPMMDRHLASTTFKYIKILLRSDRIKTQVSHLPTGCTCLHFFSFQALAYSNSCVSHEPLHSFEHVQYLVAMAYLTPANQAVCHYLTSHCAAFAEL